MPFLGSPPRVRGKGSCGSVSPLTARITPACAGKRLLNLGLHLLNGDHPRVCGEKFVYKQSGPDGRGSPPRVRGKDKNLGFTYAYTRITPACAGKRDVFLEYVAPCEDHPRVCGEKTKKIP